MGGVGWIGLDLVRFQKIFGLIGWQCTVVLLWFVLKANNEKFFLCVFNVCKRGQLTGQLSKKQDWAEGRTATVYFPIRTGKDIFSFYCRSQTYWNRTPGENPISVKHIQSLLSFCFIAQYIFYPPIFGSQIPLLSNLKSGQCFTLIILGQYLYNFRVYTSVYKADGPQRWLHPLC